jgi:hypothetical protein
MSKIFFKPAVKKMWAYKTDHILFSSGCRSGLLNLTMENGFQTQSRSKLKLMGDMFAPMKLGESM